MNNQHQLQKPASPYSIQQEQQAMQNQFQSIAAIKDQRKFKKAITTQTRSPVDDSGKDAKNIF